MKHQYEENDTKNQKQHGSEIKTIRIKLIRNKNKKEDINERDNPQQEKNKNLKQVKLYNDDQQQPDNNDDFLQRNLNINDFNSKIDDNLNYYRNKGKIIFSSEQKNNDSMSIDKRISSTNKPPFNETIPNPSQHYTNTNKLSNINKSSTFSFSNIQNNINQPSQTKSTFLLSYKKPPTISDFSLRLDKTTDEIIQYIPYKQKRNKVLKEFTIGLIGGGSLFILGYFLSNEETQMQIRKTLNSIQLHFYIGGSLIILGSIALYLIYHKYLEDKILHDIGFEDYLTLMSILTSKDEENFIGIFQSTFIKEMANKRNMNIIQYSKKIVPIIEDYIMHNENIESVDYVISDQLQSVWKFK
jgi:hypothetical protein